MRKVLCTALLCSMIVSVQSAAFAKSSTGRQILGNVLGTLINEAAKNSQRGDERTTEKTSSAPVVSSRQMYDELVKICKSGSLERFKAKCKSWKLSPTSEISFNIQEEDAESGEMITLTQRYDLLFIAASSSSNANIVKYLLDNGADVNKANSSEYYDWGLTPLTVVASKNPVPEIAKVLLEHGADKDSYDSALSMAASSFNASENPSRLEIVKLLLRAGADVNAHNGAALTAAVHSLEFVNVLLNAGADVNADNGAALRRAAGMRGDRRRIVGGDKNFDNTDVVAALIKAGANVNARGKNTIEWSPLAAAVINNNNAEAALMLIKAGADVKAKDDGGDSIIRYAASYCTDARVMRELIRRGANIKERDHANYTALQHAVIRNTPEVVNVLLDAGADTKVKDPVGRTILDLANANPKLSGTQVLKRLEAASKNTTSKNTAKPSSKKTTGRNKKRK